jgi:hypothetical protein
MPAGSDEEAPVMLENVLPTLGYTAKALSCIVETLWVRKYYHYHRAGGYNYHSQAF